jgi:uncharacterized membrane protein
VIRAWHLLRIAAGLLLQVVGFVVGMVGVVLLAIGDATEGAGIRVEGRT